MLKIGKTDTDTYKSGNYYIDIVITEKEIGAWIWSKNYGIKLHMWSEPLNQTTYYTFLNNVSESIEYYKNIYQEDYED